MQPFLCSVGPTLVVPDIPLKFLYSVFRGANLKRKLVSDAQRLLVIVFRGVSGPPKQA
jgi:hypothetical protein